MQDLQVLYYIAKIVSITTDKLIYHTHCCSGERWAHGPLLYIISLYLSSNQWFCSVIVRVHTSSKWHYVNLVSYILFFKHGVFQIVETITQTHKIRLSWIFLIIDQRINSLNCLKSCIHNDSGSFVYLP